MEKNRPSRPFVLVAMLLIVGIGLLFNFSFIKQDNTNATTEQQLAQILSEMETVGQVVVYFHYEQQKQQQFLAVTQQHQVSGVIIVAQGAHDTNVQLLLKQTVGNVLQIPTHRIQVVAMQNKEEAE